MLRDLRRQYMEVVRGERTHLKHCEKCENSVTMGPVTAVNAAMMDAVILSRVLSTASKGNENAAYPIVKSQGLVRVKAGRAKGRGA